VQILRRKKRYQPYVPDFLSLCERNYARLRHLLPDDAVVGHAVCIRVSALDLYQLKLQDSAPFTTTIRIEHINDAVPQLLRAQFEVRLYHDARLAEVTACHKVRRFKAVYDYPNLEMLQPDEKRQINLLLRDWLALCQRQGLAELSLPR